MHLPRHAHHTLPVVAHGAQHAGHQASVSAIVKRKIIGGDGVPAMTAIQGTHPHVGRQIFVGVIDARIHHRHHDVVPPFCPVLFNPHNVPSRYLGSFGVAAA